MADRINGNSSGQDLPNLRKANVMIKERQKVLSEILDITLKIRDEAERNEEDSDIKIDALADARGALVERLVNVEAAARHYAAALGGEEARLFEAAKKPGGELYKVLADINRILADIKTAESVSLEKIKILMDDVKEKISAAKERRAIMEKYTDSEDEDASGVLLSEKK